MVRKIDQKVIVKELSISFLQARGGRNKALDCKVCHDQAK